ncbi:MAG: hypothetical protein ACRCYF_07285 [Shewanella sp.]
MQPVNPEIMDSPAVADDIIDERLEELVRLSARNVTAINLAFVALVKS